MLLNDALRLVRQYHRLQVTELAQKLETSKSYISEIENGRKPVTMELLQKYADIFKIPASSLLLFAEKADHPTLPDKVQKVVAEKVIKMLEWVADTHPDQDANSSSD